MKNTSTCQNKGSMGGRNVHTTPKRQMRGSQAYLKQFTNHPRTSPEPPQHLVSKNNTGKRKVKKGNMRANKVVKKKVKQLDDATRFRALLDFYRAGGGLEKKSKGQMQDIKKVMAKYGKGEKYFSRLSATFKSRGTVSRLPGSGRPTKEQLEKNVRQSFADYPVHLIERAYQNLSLVCGEIIKHHGGNFFDVPHGIKEGERKKLPGYVDCSNFHPPQYIQTNTEIFRK